jgi:hypothetical protein
VQDGKGAGARSFLFAHSLLSLRSHTFFSSVLLLLVCAVQSQSALREIEMHARVEHYVPGVLALLAATEVVGANRTSLKGAVRMVEKFWGATPDYAWVEREDGNRVQVIDELPTDGWTLLACELSTDGTLDSWTKRTDARNQGIRTGLLKRSIGTDYSAFARHSILQVLGEDAHAILARSVLARLFRHVLQQHEHGVVHFDLKVRSSFLLFVLVYFCCLLIYYSFVCTSSQSPRIAASTANLTGPSVSVCSTTA